MQRFGGRTADQHHDGSHAPEQFNLPVAADGADGADAACVQCGFVMCLLSGGNTRNDDALPSDRVGPRPTTTSRSKAFPANPSLTGGGKRRELLCMWKHGRRRLLRWLPAVVPL